jgi:hypothetical protein
MVSKKTIFLFLALILPTCIFLFLKFFGRNEFTVDPFYVDVVPERAEGCTAVVDLPYSIPDSIMAQLPEENAELIFVKFGDFKGESANQIRRIKEEFTKDPVALLSLPATPKSDYWRNCVFFLKEPFDAVMIDRHGVIHGQYSSADREEIDRLITEVSILLKKY